MSDLEQPITGESDSVEGTIPVLADIVSNGQPMHPWPSESVRILIPAFILLDLFTIPLVAGVVEDRVVGAWFATAGGAALVAQFVLMTTWGVLGSPRLILRLPLSMLGATLFYTIAALGTIGVHMQQGEEIQGLLLGATLVPLGVLSIQGPIWLVRAFFDWTRFDAQGNEPKQGHGSRQFGLQDMLVLTAVIAAALGLAQGFSKWGLEMTAAGVEANFILLIMAVYLGMLVTIACVFFLLPCITACLIVQNTRNGLIGLMVYGAILVMGITAIPAFNWASPDEIMGVFFFAGAAVGTPLLVIGGTLSVVRLSGYRLVRRRKSRPPLQTHGRQTECPFALDDEAKAGQEGESPFAEDTSPGEAGPASDPFLR